VFTGLALPVLKGFRAGNRLSLLIIGGKADKGCNGLLMGLGLIVGSCWVVGGG